MADIVNKKDILEQLLQVRDNAFNQLLLDILNWDAISLYANSDEVKKLKKMITAYLDAREVDGKWLFPVNYNVL